MYHYKARIYSPTLGRFMQTDPIGYDDGPHLYAYVGNDPVNGTDPTGTERRDWDSPFDCAGEKVHNGCSGGSILDNMAANVADPQKPRGQVAAGPKAPKQFLKPTNPPQMPPKDIPDGHRLRIGAPNSIYQNGYFKIEKILPNGKSQPIDISTGKPPSNVSVAEGRARTHVELPEGAYDKYYRPLSEETAIATEENGSTNWIRRGRLRIIGFLCIFLCESPVY